jgi:hypothetical protein
MSDPLGVFEPVQDTPHRARRATWLTAAVVLALVALIVLLTPVTDDDADTRLTIEKYGRGNAKLFGDLTGALGWRVQRTRGPLQAPLDTTVIYAVFDGPTPLTSPERAALLDAVRRGAGLLVSRSAASSFSLIDSLGLIDGPAGLVTTQSLGDCPADTDPFDALRIRPNMLTFDTIMRARGGDSARIRPWPANSVTLLASVVTIRDDDDDDANDATPRVRVDTTRARSGPLAAADTADTAAAQTDSAIVAGKARALPTVLGFPLARGRVVAIADPDVLRTDQLRDCSRGASLSVVRSLEYLSEGRQRTVVVAEHLQAEHEDSASTVLWEWLRGAALGRVVLTGMAACVLWLLARGRRTLAPVHQVREERRSALEHVDALATAWQAVRGTRTVARLLSRGIRRRHAAGRWRNLDDAAFLAALAARHPAIAADAARLAGAIETPVKPDELPALRAAAAAIDAECLTP